MKPLRVGIVGCGRMGSERASACATLGHSVTLLHDLDFVRAEAMAKSSPACRIVHSVEERDLKGLDAVFICTPPAFHEDYVRAALRAGIPFLLEKPIGISAESFEPILHELRDCPVVNAIGYMNRCRPSVHTARLALSSCRTLGISCHWAGRVYKVPWWLDSNLSGGPLNEQATHLVDLCRFLVGEIETVHAMAPPAPDAAPELTFVIALLFVGGQVGSILYTCEALEKEIGIRILAEEGSIELSSWEFRMTANTINLSTPAQEAIPAFTAETELFLRAVTEHNPSGVSCDLVEACRTQLVVDAIRFSMRSGLSMRVGELGDRPSNLSLEEGKPGGSSQQRLMERTKR